MLNQESGREGGLNSLNDPVFRDVVLEPERLRQECERHGNPDGDQDHVVEVAKSIVLAMHKTPQITGKTEIEATDTQGSSGGGTGIPDAGGTQT